VDARNVFPPKPQHSFPPFWFFRKARLHPCFSNNNRFFVWCRICKKLENESVVCQQTALVLINLDGRHSPKQLKNRDRHSKETRTREVVAKISEKAAVRTTWVESPVTYPNDLVLIQLTSRHEKSAKVIFHWTSMYLDQYHSSIRYMYPIRIWSVIQGICHFIFWHCQ
jgi:hypothetical protein